MKVYLCGPCDTEHRTTMMEVANTLRKNDFTVYCPWELKIKNAWDMPQEEWATIVFNNDITAIDNCDVFLMISYGRISSAGSNFELGYAYAIGKLTCVIQITASYTSLMTYCGCNYYCDNLKRSLNDQLKWIMEHLYKNDLFDYEKECNTTLT